MNLASATLPWLTVFVKQNHLDEPLREGVTPVTDSYFHVHPAVYAFAAALVSCISLPIGAAFGLALPPASDTVLSMITAFGAGALLFAVTVELYGHALSEVVAGKSGFLEMLCTVCGAIIGCGLYLVVNEWLEAHIDDESGSEENPQESPAIEPFMPVTRPVHRRSSDSMLYHNMQRKVEEASIKAARQQRRIDTQASLVETATQPSVAVERSQASLGSQASLAVGSRGSFGSYNSYTPRSVVPTFFLGLLVDGMPEGILMGCLAAEHHLTPVLIISLLVANIPEGFSSSSLLMQAEVPTLRIIGMWTCMTLLVASLSGATCYTLLAIFPQFGHSGFASHSLPIPVLVSIALTEGITGGAMLACITSVMLPEAFDRGEKGGRFFTQSGFWCVCGFMLAVLLKTFYG